MSFKFNPFTGKLDMVGGSQGNGGATAGNMIITDGVMREKHGGLEKGFDFGKNNLTLKETLERILLPSDVEITPSNDQNYLEGTSQTFGATFKIAKGKHKISSVKIIGGNSEVNADDETLAAINSGEAISVSSSKSNVVANSELVCTVEQDGAADKTATVHANFFYPYLIFATAIVSGFDTVKLLYKNGSYTIIAFEKSDDSNIKLTSGYSLPVAPALGSKQLKGQNIINNADWPRIGILTKGEALKSAAPTGTTAGMWPHLSGITVKLTFNDKSYNEYTNNDFVVYGGVGAWSFYYTTNDANTESANDPAKSGVKFDFEFKD